MDDNLSAFAQAIRDIVNPEIEKETRDVLDPQENVIGTIELPSDTEEPAWEDSLGAYSTPIPSPTIQAIVKGKITSAMEFGKYLMLEVGTDNILLGLNTEQIISMIIDYGHIKAMLDSGSLYTALTAIEAVQPTEIMTQQRIDKYAGMLKSFLRI